MCINKLNKLTKDNDNLQSMSLEEVIVSQPEGSEIFNYASEAWNHAFYFNSIDSQTHTSPTERIARAINESFGSLERFNNMFLQEAMEHFGSGWVWVVRDNQDRLEIMSTHDAGSMEL